MSRDFNQNRVTNAKIGRETLNKFGANFAINYGLDGFNIVDIQTSEAPSNIVEYFEGNDTYEIFGLPTNITKLCNYALASFPSITDLYLFTNSVIDIEDDLSYLTNLNAIYVSQDLLSAYQTKYANVPNILNKLGTVPVDYELTIPVYDNIGNVLNDQAINYFISGLSQQQKEALTKLIISTDYVDYYSEVWHYNFSNTFENLDDNIYYGSTKIDMSNYIIQGSGELTANIVETQIYNISSEKKSNINIITVPISFTNYVAKSLDGIEELINCDTLSVPFDTLNQKKILTSLTSNSGKIKKLIVSKSGSISGDRIDNINSISELYINNASSLGVYAIWSCNNLEYIYAKELTSITRSGAIGGNGTTKLKKLYAPKLQSVLDDITNLYYVLDIKVFISNSSCNFNRINGQKAGKLYCKAEHLSNYMSTIPNVGTLNILIGVIDGDNIYNNLGIKDNKLSMNYSKLTGIDTEANIQLLTPTEDSLYLASDTGDLWQYTNSAWVNLFSTDFTGGATWYSDEACTTTVLPANITTAMTVYCKLTTI